MSATGLEVVTFEFPRDIENTSEFQRVPANLSFNYDLSRNVRTLSSNFASQGADLTGFLYVPDLAPGNVCYNSSTPYVPLNVTRQSDLSPRNGMVALAPWISPECTHDYLNAAPRNSTNAFIFFLPDQGNTVPPSSSDSAWDLGDGGKWKSSYNFPVYAVSTQVGELLLDEMALYSSNASSVPYGKDLTDNFGYPEDAYVRLYIDIGTSGTPGLPSIWVFLLIILAILLALVGLLSLAMHLMQRRRRNRLRSRIANGDVDVEALGIGKLTVPQDVVNKMPLYVYTSQSDDSLEKGRFRTSHSSNLPPLYQPTCAICLDDFTPGESRVRELPCRHIFHPECIDLFLHDNSSLCPLCKKTVLPSGYCPTKITNSMVRRERYITRARQRVARDSDEPEDTSSHRGSRLSAFFRRQSRMSGETLTPSSAPVEMTSVEAASAAHPPLSSSGLSRREWTRRRALAMLGPRPSPHVPDQEPEPSSRFRKLLRTIFPGIGL